MLVITVQLVLSIVLLSLVFAVNGSGRTIGRSSMHTLQYRYSYGHSSKKNILFMSNGGHCSSASFLDLLLFFTFIVCVNVVYLC